MDFNYFEIHLVDHCNLNCQSCDNFSPLADEIYVNKLKFNRDLRRLSILAKDKIKNVRMLGGEPLLHPEVSDFLKISRNYFPEANVRLTTNGIKLSKMPENFWRTCNETRAIIEITYYPININKEEIKRLAKEYAVVVVPFDKTDKIIKTSYRNPVKEEKSGNPDKKYKKCYQRGRCVSLKDGKIYPCTCIPNICHFNKYFNKNLEVTEEDYIDIYKVKDIKEIEKFLDNAPPFCGYCDVMGRTSGKPWGTSKKDIKEWFNE